MNEKDLVKLIVFMMKPKSVSMRLKVPPKDNGPKKLDLPKIEKYGTNDLSKAYASHARKIITKYLEAAINNNQAIKQSNVPREVVRYPTIALKKVLDL